MNRTIRIFDKEGNPQGYLSERMGNYPENSKELDILISNLSEGSSWIIKDGPKVISEGKKEAKVKNGK